jgi:maleate cis-trans isomerase
MPSQFSRINFHHNVVLRFQEFSKSNEVSYTNALVQMLDFFEEHHISPFRPYDNSISNLMDTFNRRMDALEAILRNMEETQLIPTREMLESLFVEKSAMGKPWSF